MILNFGDRKKLLDPQQMNMIEDRILAMVIRFAEQNEKGVYMPETAAKEFICATVLDIGPLVNAGFKENDIVTFRPRAGTLFRADGKEYIVLRQSEIVSWFKAEAAVDYTGPENPTGTNGQLRSNNNIN